MDRSKIFKEKEVYTKPYSSKYEYFRYGKYNIVLGTKEEIEDLELDLFSQLESYDFIPFRFEPFEEFSYERNPRLIYVEYLEKDIYRARFYFDNKNYQKEIEEILTHNKNMKWYYFDETFSLESIEYFIEDKKLIEKSIDFNELEDKKNILSYSLYSIRREFKDLDIKIIEVSSNKFQLHIIDYLKNTFFYFDILEEDFSTIINLKRKKILNRNRETLYLNRRNFYDDCNLEEEMYYYDSVLEKRLNIVNNVDENILKDDLLEDEIFFLIKKELQSLIEKYTKDYSISTEYLDLKSHYLLFDDKDLVNSKDIYLVNRKFNNQKYKEWLKNYFEKSYCYIKGLIDQKNDKVICYILYSKYMHNDSLVIFIEDIGICSNYKKDIDYLQFFSKSNLVEVVCDERDKTFFIEQLKKGGYKEENGFFRYKNEKKKVSIEKDDIF